MLNEKEKKTLFFLEIVEFILSMVAIVIFTLIFRLEVRAIRYLFLLGDIYVIYSFAKTIPSLEAKIEEKLLKEKQKEPVLEAMKKLSI